MSKRTGLPMCYSAAEVAESLKCSEWWVKEQARRRRIPFLRSGGGYCFTSDHVQEIICLIEERPVQMADADQDSPTLRRLGNREPMRPVTSLRARSPRRARKAA